MRIRKRPKIPISGSDLETPPTSHATHAGGSSVSSIGAPPPVAAGGGLHLDRDLPPKSSGCNTYGSSVGGGDLILPVPTQMEGTHLKLKGKERTEILGNLHSFDNNNNNTDSTWDAESSFFSLKKKKRGEAMEVVDERKATKTKHSTTMGHDQNCTIDEKKNLKRKSPAVLMEGSRCSRVNGRGWRCCQQTLVGYSLCEHHLGKGRLRSVNNSNISHEKFKNNNKRKEEEGTTVEIDGCFDDREEDEMKVMISGRRRKIGIVKARSISSLLDQTISSDVNSNNVVIPPPKDEVLVAAATTRRTDQVTPSMEVSSATIYGVNSCML